MTIARDKERSQDRVDVGARGLAHSDLLPTTVDAGDVLAARYRLLTRLGRGGMGVVFEAEDLSALGERVAVKVLSRAHGADLARFKNEFRALTDVRHPNLVRLHQLAAWKGTWFLVMDLVDGVDFLGFVRPDGQLDEARLRRVLVELFAAVSALHAAGKVHGDLKPTNVLVTRGEGSVRVIDFGLIRDTQDGPGSDASLFLGTPAYAAPEQAFRESWGPSADVYALGAMLYEALTGRVPFPGDNVSALVRKLGHDPDPPSNLAAGLPADLERLTLRLIARDPTQRPTAHEVLAELGAPGAAAWAESSALLLGRDRELDVLEAALDESRAGPVLVLAHGPSGIGKSSLLRRFGEVAHDTRFALVLHGRCYAREQVPFKAFDALFEQLARRVARLSEPERARLGMHDLEVLARVFPAFERTLGPQRPRGLPAHDPFLLRERAFRALKQVLSGLAQVTPLVLCLDDLQWGDSDSAALLRELITPPGAPPCLFVCAFRSEERDTSPMLQTLRSAPLAVRPRELSLKPLTLACAEQLLCALVPHGAAPERIAEAAQESRGSPFLLHELARLLREGRNSVLPELVPHGADLPETTRGLLQLVAIAGRPIPLPVAISASGASVASLLELVARRLVRLRIVDDCECIEPYHDRLREAVARDIGDERVPGLLRGLARVHAQAHPEQVDVLVELHQRAGDLDRAAHYAVGAAEQAERALAFDRAADLYAFALAYGVQGDRATLEVACATACARAGRVREAGARYERAALLLDDPAARREVLRKAMLYHLTGGDLAPGERILRGLCSELGLRFPTSRIWLAVAWAWWLYFVYVAGPRLRKLPTPPPREGDPRSPDDERLELAFMAARGLGHHSFVRASAFVVEGLLETRRLRSPRHWATALAWEAQLETVGPGVPTPPSDEAMARSISLSAERGTIEERALILASSGARDVYLGRLRTAEQAFEGAEQLLRDHGQPVLAVCNFTRSGRLATWHATGDFDKVLAHADRWLLEARALGDPFGELVVHVMGSHRFLALDQVEAARESLRALATPLGQRSQFGADPWWRADLELYDAKPQAALDACREARAQPLQLAVEATSLHRAWLAFTEARAGLALWAAGDTHKRALVRSRLARLRRQHYAPARYQALHIEGAMAELSGERDRALSCFAEAAEGYESLGMALYAAAMRYREGRLFGEAGGTRLLERAFERASARAVHKPERWLRTLAPG